MSSAEKTIRLLNKLADYPYSSSLSELAEGINTTRSGAYKLLRLLENHYYVSKDENSKRYSLGPALLRLGYVYNQKKGIQEVATPVLEEITSITDETTYLSLRDHADGFMAYIVRSSQITLFDADMGRKLKINAGTSGKLLAAYQTPEEISRMLLEANLEPKTPFTIINKEELRKEYDLIRQRGFSEGDEDYELGIFALSVPIFDHNKKVWACISAAGPKERFLEKDKRIMILGLLRNGAKRIQEKMEFR